MSAEELRELDSWIEENIFGRRRVEAGTHYHWPSQREIDDLKKACPELAAVSYIGAREFTTNDADAALVRRKCIDLIPRGIRIQRRPQGDWFVCKYEDLEPVWATGETEQIAVCLFAKKLHGG